jgi:predicted Zn-dependent protease
MRRRLLFAVAGAAALAAAQAHAASPLQLREAQSRPALTTVEGGLWDLADKAEAQVKASAQLDADPALNGFVHDTLCKVAGDYCGDLRLYVLDRPEFNASAAPNGYVEVYSGLLLRAETEDQLAYVLAHEVSHFTRNHSLARYPATKQTAGVAMVVSVGLGVAAGSAGGLVSDLVYLGALASVMSYGREQEAEADALGFQRAADAGYAPAAGPGMWNALVAETKASDFPKVRASETRGGVFRSHPITAERIAALEALAKGRAGPEKPGAARRYRAVIRPHLAAWLKDALRRRDYGQSLQVIDHLSALGEDQGVLEFYRGEAYRQRRADGDAEKALAAYRKAVAFPDAPAVAWRELGEASLKAGDRAAARDAFAAYLTHVPDAQDRWLVEGTLKSLQDS